MQRRQRAARGDFEDRPIVVGPAIHRCPVEVPIGGLDQPRPGVATVHATALRTKAVQRRQRAAWGDFEDRAVLIVGPAIPVVP